MPENNSEREYAFFCHRNCEYFPCHENADPYNFNCLFCFCPLYFWAENCGGNFRMLKSGLKDCSHCLIPHVREGYDIIREKLDGHFSQFKDK